VYSQARYRYLGTFLECGLGAVYDASSCVCQCTPPPLTLRLETALISPRGFILCLPECCRLLRIGWVCAVDIVDRASFASRRVLVRINWIYGDKAVDEASLCACWALPPPLCPLDRCRMLGFDADDGIFLFSFRICLSRTS
jgi:hypothetical protein